MISYKTFKIRTIGLIILVHLNGISQQINIMNIRECKNKITVPLIDTNTNVLTTKNSFNVDYDSNSLNRTTIIQSKTTNNLINFPDIPIGYSPYNTLSENAIMISPHNVNIILNAENYSDWPSISVLAVDEFHSINNGVNWSTQFGILNNGRADPSVAIDKQGTFYVNYINNNYGQSISISYDNGQTWIEKNIAPNPGNVADKNHLCIDNKNLNAINNINAFKNNIYVAWTDFGGPYDNQIVFVSSNNGGNTFSTRKPISTSVNAGSHNQGSNIQTGPNGEIYVCWAIYDCWPCNEASIGFSKSLDGGNTWTNANRIFSINGIRINGLIGKNMRTNSFPVMAVNQQNNHIFIVWAGYDNSNLDRNIYISKSVDGGNTWTYPIRVNQDSTHSDQWHPWIVCDETNNALIVVYYDSRNFPNNNRAETFISISYDEGNSWQDFQISDTGMDWDGNGMSGFAGNYAGDYIGVDAYLGNCIAAWGSKPTSLIGNIITYVQPFNIPCPQDLSLIYGNYFITDEVSFDDDASYSAINNIYVAGQTIHNSTYKIYPNASVYMSAGNDIIIDDGFESEGEFIAEISPCNYFGGKLSNNNSNRTLSLHTPDKEILIYTNNTNDLKNKKDESVLIAPNPASTSIIIQTSNSANTIQHIAIKDITGKTVAQQTVLPQPSTTLDISYLSNGLYFVEVQTNQGVFTEKVVVQR